MLHLAKAVSKSRHTMWSSVKPVTSLTQKPPEELSQVFSPVSLPRENSTEGERLKVPSVTSAAVKDSEEENNIHHSTQQNVH